MKFRCALNEFVECVFCEYQASSVVTGIAMDGMALHCVALLVLLLQHLESLGCGEVSGLLSWGFKRMTHRQCRGCDVA